MLYEHRRDPILPRRHFVARLLRHLGFAMLVLVGGLTVGTLGYHLVAGLPWIDAFLNASMILTGMGPVDRMDGSGAKLFASLYALFSGIVFLTASGVLVAPLFHRILHRFHLEEEQEDEDARRRSASRKARPRPSAGTA